MASHRGKLLSSGSSVVIGRGKQAVGIGDRMSADPKEKTGSTVRMCQKGSSSHRTRSDPEEPEIIEHRWVKEIGFGYISKKNVMHFPSYVSRKWLKVNQRSIVFVDEDTGESWNARIKCAKRKGKIMKWEKHIGPVWYEYAKKKNIRRRDMVRFRITPTADRLYVKLYKNSS
ncbi:uncharacterized protein LOC131598428 [Vicia villosa]|uniref:uncharacterized protein LOC131598428 n=1 Tax=Vicia villosa TaxID=3911 RepID=UPI00273CCB5E|nr:uncharacterized protein LOC131598428 [Vicia villosa]